MPIPRYGKNFFLLIYLFHQYCRGKTSVKRKQIQRSEPTKSIWLVKRQTLVLVIMKALLIAFILFVFITLFLKRQAENRLQHVTKDYPFQYSQ
jgi:hypothetical protein